MCTSWGSKREDKMQLAFMVPIKQRWALRVFLRRQEVMSDGYNEPYRGASVIWK